MRALGGRRLVCDDGGVQLYLAGPMFTKGERDAVAAVARRLEGSGHTCFVPHEQSFEPIDASTVFAVDAAGVRNAEAMVALLDGPMIDDGTACEIGIFGELVRTRPDRHRGILGLVTDWRITRRRNAGMGDGGLNYFVAGAIMEYGRLVWTVDDVVTTLDDWTV